MKILITGGSGFIGTHLMKTLLAAGHRIVNYDKNQSKTYPELTQIGDVRDLEKLSENLRDTDIVIHLAAEHKDNVSPKSLYFDVNVEGTRNLVTVCEQNNIDRIIFTSTVAVYGLHLNDSKEDSELSPFNDYGMSKLQAEQVLNDWHARDKNRSLTIIRPTVVFGEQNRGNVYNLMRQVAEKRFIMVGKGMNKKSIAYVGNLVQFIASTLDDSGFSITNYADKPDLTMRQLIDLVNQFLGEPEKKMSIPYWLGISVGYMFDCLSFLIRKEFPISSIRIKKFCSNSIINTEKLNRHNFQRSTPLSIGIENTIKYEFNKK